MGMGQLLASLVPVDMLAAVAGEGVQVFLKSSNSLYNAQSPPRTKTNNLKVFGILQLKVTKVKTFFVFCFFVLQLLLAS